VPRSITIRDGGCPIGGEAGNPLGRNQIGTRHLFFLVATFVFSLALISKCVAASQPSSNFPALMPMPARIEFRAGSVPLTRNLRFEWHGFKNGLLLRAADRLTANLTLRTGIDFVRDGSSGADVVTILIDCNADDPEYLTLNAEESYKLDITKAGVRVSANGPAGVLRAFATIIQLVQADATGFSLQAVSIEDRPRFRWRGIMIDVSRHFIPARTVEHEMDVMEALKLNVLHLHITDSESFSIESKQYPLLQEKGAIDGRYYTQDEIHELIAYGRDRGIRVVPEFEVPGHLKSWLAGYPELASGPGPFKPESEWVNGDAAINPTDERAYRFLDRLFGEMTNLFPDQFFHIGGDEVVGNQWEKNPGIQRFMRQHSIQDKAQLQAYFTRRVTEIVQAHGKTAIGWDEVLDGKAPQSMAIEAWRSSYMTARSVKAGHATIVAAPYYLDHLLSAGTHYRCDPLDDNCSGITRQEYTTLDNFHGLLTDAFVLHGPIPLTTEEQERVLGGEAQMWTETITPEMLDAGLWPRSAALAERFWSPQNIQDLDDMYRRLYVIDRLLSVLGSDHYANQKRMVDRIVPQDPAPVETLTSIIEPIKYLAHWHSSSSGEQQEQNTLADAAQPESLVAKQFCEHVHKLLSTPGWDSELADQLLVQLTEWRDNDASFKRAAADVGKLQLLIPVSADMKDLASVGLDSLEMIHAKHPPSKAWIDRENKVIGRHRQFADASARFWNARKLPQPPSDVLIAILPGIEELARAAERIGQ